MWFFGSIVYYLGKIGANVKITPRKKYFWCFSAVEWHRKMFYMHISRTGFLCIPNSRYVVHPWQIFGSGVGSAYYVLVHQRILNTWLVCLLGLVTMLIIYNFQLWAITFYGWLCYIVNRLISLYVYHFKWTLHNVGITEHKPIYMYRVYLFTFILSKHNTFV